MSAHEHLARCGLVAVSRGKEHQLGRWLARALYRTLTWCRHIGERQQWHRATHGLAANIRGSGRQVGHQIELDGRLRILTEDIANVMARVEAEEHLKASRRTSQQLAAKLLTAQEDERRHLAREMHDDITQRLAAAAIECGQLQKQAELPEEPQKVVSGLLNSLIQLSTDVHQLSRRMHPSILDDLGLLDALLHECNSAKQDRPEPPTRRIARRAVQGNPTMHLSHRTRVLAQYAQALSGLTRRDRFEWRRGVGTLASQR